MKIIEPRMIISEYASTVMKNELLFRVNAVPKLRFMLAPIRSTDHISSIIKWVISPVQHEACLTGVCQI